MDPAKTSKPIPNRPIAPAAASSNVMSMPTSLGTAYLPPPMPGYPPHHAMLSGYTMMRGPLGPIPPQHTFPHVPFGASAAAISASAHPKSIAQIRTSMPSAPKISGITPHLPPTASLPSQTLVSPSVTTTSRPSSPTVPVTSTTVPFQQQSSDYKSVESRDRGSPHVTDKARKAASPRSASPTAPSSSTPVIPSTKSAIPSPVLPGHKSGQPLMLPHFSQGHSQLAVATFPQTVIPPPSPASVCITQSQSKPTVPVVSLPKMFPSHVNLVAGRPGIGQAEPPSSPDISRLGGKQSGPASPIAIPQHNNPSSTATSSTHLIPVTAPLPTSGVVDARIERPHQGVTLPNAMLPNPMYSQYVLSEHGRGYPLSFPHAGFHQQLPSGIRPPHTQTTAAMSGMQFLDHQSIFAAATSNALRNLGAGTLGSEGIGQVAMVDSSTGNPGIFSMQLGMQQAPNLQVAVSASNPNATSPRPSILRKRTSEGLRKPTIVPYNNDVPPPVASEPSASPRSDSTLSAPQSGQSSPKPPSDAGNQAEQQQQQPPQPQVVTPPTTTPTEQIPTSQPPASPVTVKKEQTEPAVSTAVSTAVISSTAMATSTSSTIDKPATNAVALPDGASPRKKPRKQNVVATEDKYGSSVPLEEASSDDEDKKAKQPAEDPMDDDLKFILCKRPKISIYGGYKVNTKAAYNHFQKYSDVRIKEERKPTVQDIANQKNILHRVSGWRVHHVAAQMDDLTSVEQQVLQKLFDFRENLPKPRPGQKTKYHDELVMLDELVQGNIQRCQLVAEQLADIRKVMVKVLDHRPKCVDILHKYMHKRNPKKKS